VQRSVENALNHIVTAQSAGIWLEDDTGRRLSAHDLVRPDRVIAWRTRDATDPLAQLSQAMRRILGGAAEGSGRGDATIRSE
jgi:hypothetical protein